MPILIKDYNWRQTEEQVLVHVPLKGVCLNKVDIFTSDDYLKISSPPFLFELCLWQPVDEADSDCTLANGEAVFRLVKQTPGTWPSLSAELTKQEAMEVKHKAIEKAQAKAELKKKEYSEKKDQRQKAAVKEAITLHTQELDLIKETKERAKEEALVQMGWRKTQSSVRITELPQERREPETKVSKEIFEPTNKSSNNKSHLPKPRESGQISVSFTPRDFPTPCRESKMAEEQEWLCKQAEARRRTGFVAEDLRPEERDPLWLCDKAQSFYEVGNYLGAVSAYTHAISLNSHLYELYAGRAAAQLALKNFHNAITDSSKALELLTPPVPQNADARVRCLQCRGRALAGAGLKPEALGELKAALAIRPDCPEIQTVITEVESKQDQCEDDPKKCLLLVE